MIEMGIIRPIPGLLLSVTKRVFAFALATPLRTRAFGPADAMLSVGEGIVVFYLILQRFRKTENRQALASRHGAMIRVVP